MNKHHIDVAQGRGFIKFTSFIVFYLVFFLCACFSDGDPGTTFIWLPVTITAGWALFWAILFTAINS